MPLPHWWTESLESHYPEAAASDVARMMAVAHWRTVFTDHTTWSPQDLKPLWPPGWVVDGRDVMWRRTWTGAWVDELHFYDPEGQEGTRLAWDELIGNYGPLTNPRRQRFRTSLLKWRIRRQYPRNHQRHHDGDSMEE